MALLPTTPVSAITPALHMIDHVLIFSGDLGHYGGQADLHCPRDPRKAALLDICGSNLMNATTTGDAASFEVMPGDLVNLRVDFS